MNLKYSLLCLVIILSYNIEAQNWLLGGNGVTPPPSAVSTANNFIGTNASNNTWIKIGVQGSQDIFIDNNPAQLYPAPLRCICNAAASFLISN